MNQVNGSPVGGRSQWLAARFGAVASGVCCGLLALVLVGVTLPALPADATFLGEIGRSPSADSSTGTHVGCGLHHPPGRVGGAADHQAATGFHRPEPRRADGTHVRRVTHTVLYDSYPDGGPAVHS
jgi:hypothetical protein